MKVQTYTGEVYPVEGTNMNLPMANDLNGSLDTSDYCTNGFNPGATPCVGAKLWLVPNADISATINANGSQTITWDGANFLFETNLMTYTADITAPVITLLGDATVNLTVGDSYADAGATALDDVDGIITGSIVTVNPVNTAVVGSYIVTYNVSDAALNPAIEMTRTVNVSAAPAPTPTPAPAPSGGGGGGSPALAAGGGGFTAPTIPVQTGIIPVAPATGQVLSATAFRFTSALQVGSKGDDVTELQKRLTQEGVYSGPITGYFGPLTFAAVKAYQAKTGIESVGIVGPLTRTSLNSILAQATTTGQVLGAQTSAEVQAKIKELQAKLAELQAQLQELIKQNNQ